MFRFFVLIVCSLFYVTNATNSYIENLVLYDTNPNPGVNLGPLETGMTINLATVGSDLTILAQINSTVVGYVVFNFDDTYTNKENFPFYALNGNSNTFLRPFAPLSTVGPHKLVAEFYDVITNKLLDTISSTFIVIDTSSETSNGPLVGFSLYNTMTGYGEALPSVVNLQEVGRSLSIVATTRTREVDDVVFWFDNKFVRVENGKPWAINGNEGSRIFPFSPLLVPGVHTVVAFAQGFNAEMLGNLTFTFIVQESSSTKAPFRAPLPVPTVAPSIRTNRPSTAPSNNVLTQEPTPSPSTEEPTMTPTEFKMEPTSFPTVRRTLFPVEEPTSVPNQLPETEEPTTEVTTLPTAQPSDLLELTLAPSKGRPSSKPEPTPSPNTEEPTMTPTKFEMEPSSFPIVSSTFFPVEEPTSVPNRLPETEEPTTEPTTVPTAQPSDKSEITIAPSKDRPSSNPTILTSVVPTVRLETEEPTVTPTSEPSNIPTISQVSSVIPTQPLETEEPTAEPTLLSVATPTLEPETMEPTNSPTNDASRGPTIVPSSPVFKEEPTSAPTKKFSLAPVTVPPPVKAPNPTSGNATVSGELKKWHKVTLSFTGPFTSETDAVINPFMDYRLDVTFVHGATKKQYIVPGYYAADGDAAESSASSGNQWHCHFSPDTTGLWMYSVSFVKGKDVAVNRGGSPSFFDGEMGSFEINRSDKTGRDHRGKGRLRYVGAHHLQFAEGEWFLKAGADSPENFLAYEDFDNTPDIGDRRKSWSPHVSDHRNGDSTWQGSKGTGIIGAVNYLSNEGMNVFSFLTMNIAGDDENVFPFISDSPEDRLRIDVSKLAQWEIVFEHADKMGMYLHFKLAEKENDDLLDGGLLGNERKLYYRELIARFSHHLALNWNLAEEIGNPVDKINAFSDFFKETDPYNHIVVLHTDPSSALYTEFLGYPSVDGASLQDNPSRVFSNTLRWVLQSEAVGKKWIVSNDEQNSANDGVLPDSVDPDHDFIRTNSLWGNIMAGGAGVEYYFGYDHEQSDLTCEDFRSRANMWKQSRHALSFFRDNEVPFWTMSNENIRLADESNNWVLLSEDGSTLVLYRISSDETGINMVGLSGRYSIEWYNPREGGPLLRGSVTSIIGGGNAALYGNAPESDDKDWVVLIRRF